MTVKWIKIAVDIFDDEKLLLIEQMPDSYAIITVWFKLLCLAGKQNNSGVFMINDKIPYTDEMFATIFRMQLNTVRLALTTFERYGMIEIINNTVTIPKWGKHQSLDKLEKQNEYMRGYMREYRKKQLLLASGTADDCKPNSKTNNKPNVSGADKEEDKNKNKNLLRLFDAFWSAYPRKVAKPNALKAFEKIQPDDALLAKMLTAIDRAKASPQWIKDGGQFIPHPATWLNAHRWEDEVQQHISDDLPRGYKAPISD